MKESLLLVLVALLGLASAIGAPAPKSPPFRAGAAVMGVTSKEFPLNMPGGISANMAGSAHDPLHARALVLDDGATTLALAVVDNSGVAFETCREAKVLAAQRCGIKPDKILACWVHTHSAPSSGATSGPAPAAVYQKVLVEAIVRTHDALLYPHLPRGLVKRT